MPTIQSRKFPENKQYIDPNGWDEMIKKGLAGRFRIIDDQDLQDTVTKAPEVVNMETIEIKEVEEDEPNRHTPTNADSDDSSAPCLLSDDSDSNVE